MEIRQTSRERSGRRIRRFPVFYRCRPIETGRNDSSLYGRVTEAFDASGQIFGEDRLLRLCEKLKTSSSAEELVKGVLSGTETFYQGATQSDDITVLALTRRGGVVRAARG